MGGELAEQGRGAQCGERPGFQFPGGTFTAVLPGAPNETAIPEFFDQ